MPKRDYDPLSCLPTIEIVRRRLAKAEQTVAKYRVLLETLERIQAAEQADAEPQGGSHE